MCSAVKALDTNSKEEEEEEEDLFVFNDTIEGQGSIYCAVRSLETNSKAPFTNALSLWS